MNIVMLQGRLGSDAMLKYTKSGNPVCEISLATSEYQGKGKQNKTEWHKVLLWGKTAEYMKPSLTKGSMLFVQGSVAYRTWDDKDGNKKYTTEINCFKAVLLEAKGSFSEKESLQVDPGQRPAGRKEKFSVMESEKPDYTTDDIPF